ncbi:MAG: hypothetical protein MUO60_16710 [Clostridiaceae bacterium]|nr:hypothetical protein [Clostridiaceae bacterium]
MLQQPSWFININKTSKNDSTNINLENSNLNNSSTEFTPPIQDENVENDSESMIPICDKSSMAKFLVILKLLQRPRYNEDIHEFLKNRKTNINIENKTSSNDSKNKLNAKFILFFRQVPFKNNSQFIKNKGEVYTNSDDTYETCENQNDDFFESLIPTPPITIEAEDIIEDIDREK